MAARGNGRVAYVNARLLDPASGLDAPGALLTDGERIADLGPRLFNDGLPDGAEVVDCHGAVPGAGPDRHARPAARARRGAQGDDRDRPAVAAAAGGVTSWSACPTPIR